MPILNPNFTFIDLFAGIGGFRYAMDNYSSGQAVCLYASEINKDAQRVYEKNFHQVPYGDITKLNPRQLGFPAPDVVCAGFPCQAFSKSGKQGGFGDTRGTLFREILRIIKSYRRKKDRPKFLVMENVQNLINHDKGHTWKVIRREIKRCGYNLADYPLVLAPKDVGVPQLRNRAIILAVRSDIFGKPIDFELPRAKAGTTYFEAIREQNIDSTVLKKCSLSKAQVHLLEIWDDLIKRIPMEDRVIGFPLWTDEFGLDYPLQPLRDNELGWKADIIQRNRDFYEKHRKTIDAWFARWNVRETLNSTQRKFEWQAGTSMDSVFEGIIQFRTSGIRVKRPTECPALVAMNHRPIYGPEKRYITLIEAKRLQSFPDEMDFSCESENEALKQLGNAVNVKVIETAFREFVSYIEDQINKGDE